MCLSADRVFLDRKEKELRFKLSSLPQELKFWRERGAVSKSLEKNHSQITRLTLQLEGLQAKLEAELVSTVRSDQL